MQNTDFNSKNTEKFLVFQRGPGVRMKDVLSLIEHYPIQVDCYDGEESTVLLFPFGSVGTLPMVFVHRLEYSPFRIVSKFFRNGRSIEAFFNCRSCSFSRKFIDNSVSSQCCISKPVAYHNSIVAESKLIEPVNDDLCTSRHQVGVFACNHNCIGIKLNIEADGVSIILFPIQPTAVAMSEIILNDNASNSGFGCLNYKVTKCQITLKSASQKCSLKTPSNHEANHVSNHERDFVICATSNTYNGDFSGANHVSNHDANHDIAKMELFCALLSTQLTTIGMSVKCVIPNTYTPGNFDSNHVSNHDRLKNGGSKKKVTTKVTTIHHLAKVVKSISYGCVILSANHVSNHDGKQKSHSEMTYSSILYIIILEIIIINYTNRGRYAHAHTRETHFLPGSKK